MRIYLRMRDEGRPRPRRISLAVRASRRRCELHLTTTHGLPEPSSSATASRNNRSLRFIVTHISRSLGIFFGEYQASTLDKHRQTSTASTAKRGPRRRKKEICARNRSVPGGGGEGADGRRYLPPRTPHVRWNAVQGFRRDPTRHLRRWPRAEGGVDRAGSRSCWLPGGAVQVLAVLVERCASRVCVLLGGRRERVRGRSCRCADFDQGAMKTERFDPTPARAPASILQAFFRRFWCGLSRRERVYAQISRQTGTRSIHRHRERKEGREAEGHPFTGIVH